MRFPRHLLTIKMIGLDFQILIGKQHHHRLLVFPHAKQPSRRAPIRELIPTNFIAVSAKKNRKAVRRKQVFS